MEEKDELQVPEDAVEDLPLEDEDAADVQGGKVQFQDLSFTKKIDKSTPTLGS